VASGLYGADHFRRYKNKAWMMFLVALKFIEDVETFEIYTIC